MAITAFVFAFIPVCLNLARDEWRRVGELHDEASRLADSAEAELHGQESVVVQHAARNQPTEITLRGPSTLVAEVTAPLLERVQTTSVAVAVPSSRTSPRSPVPSPLSAQRAEGKGTCLYLSILLRAGAMWG